MANTQDVTLHDLAKPLRIYPVKQVTTSEFLTQSESIAGKMIGRGYGMEARVSIPNRIVGTYISLSLF
jgi:hypothetical protein